MIFLPLLGALPYQIRPINTTSGFFYKSLGLSKISNNKYNLLVFHNLSILENQEEIISNYFSKSLGLCASTTRFNYHTSHCNEQLKIIELKLTQLKNNLDLLSQHSRHKRGILNGVSYPIKWLFGIPDSDDAQFYTNSIDELISDQRQTQTLMQQQIHVISDTISNFNNSVRSLKINEENLNANIVKFNKFSTDVTNQVLADEIEIEILDHMLSLIELTDESLSLSEKLLLSISLLRNGIITYHVIEPKVLINELNLVSQKFNLPLSISYPNLEIFYKLIKVKAFFQEKNLVIKIEVPVVNIVQDFELFQIIPLPTPHINNSQVLSYIEPNYPYILFSKTRTQFSMLKSLTKCKQYIPKEWLCEDISTFQKKNQNYCEVSLFMTTNQIPSSCKTRTIKADVELFQNINPNEWIYIVSKPTDLVILCYNNEDHETSINHMGIITLDSSCKAYTDITSIEPMTVLQNSTTHVKIPVTDITMDDCCYKKGKNTTLEALHMSPIKLSNIDLTELNYAQHRLTQFDEILQQQLNKPFIIRYQNWFTSVIIFIGSFIGLFLLYKIMKIFNLFKFLSKLLCSRKSKSESSSCTNLFHQCLITTRDSSNVVNYQPRDNRMELASIPHMPPELVTAPPSYNNVPRRSSRLSSEKSTKTKHLQSEAYFNIE